MNNFPNSARKRVAKTLQTLEKDAESLCAAQVVLWWVTLFIWQFSQALNEFRSGKKKLGDFWQVLEIKKKRERGKTAL